MDNYYSLRVGKSYYSIHFTSNKISWTWKNLVLLERARECMNKINTTRKIDFQVGVTWKSYHIDHETYVDAPNEVSDRRGKSTFFFFNVMHVLHILLTCTQIKFAYEVQLNLRKGAPKINALLNITINSEWCKNFKITWITSEI